MSSLTLFLQPGPLSSLPIDLPIVYSHFESISGLYHSLGQNLNELIISGNSTPRGMLSYLLGASHPIKFTIKINYYKHIGKNL
jgi:hypothetical protein